MHALISRYMAIIGTVFVLILHSAPSHALFQSPDIDETPPPMENRERLDGSKFGFEDFKGTPTIVYFSAFWCPWCSQTSPTVFSVAEKYKANGVKLVYVSSDDNSKRESLADLERRTGAVIAASTLESCPENKCPKGARLGKGWQINGVPAILVLDSSGVIKYRFNRVGEIQSGLERAVRRVTSSQ